MADPQTQSNPAPDPPIDRDGLLDAIVRFLSDRDAAFLARTRDVLAREIDTAGPDAFVGLLTHLATAGTDWSYYPADPLARRMHHVVAELVLGEGSGLSGI